MTREPRADRSELAELSDEEIIRRVQNGEPELLSIIVERYTATIYHLAAAVIPREDCEDVVQDILLHVVRSVQDFKETSKFKTWLYGLAKNRLADYHRSKQRHPPPATVDEAILDSTSKNPWPRILNEMTASELLAELPDIDRHIIVLRVMQGMSFGEIAEMFGTSYEAVRSRYRRAIARLADRYARLNEAL